MDEATPIRPIPPTTSAEAAAAAPPRAYGAPRGAQMALAAPAPLPAAGAAPRSRVVITEELGDVLETPVGPGEAMLVRAVAGAGKSTMLELRARRNPIQKFLYLAYNDSVAEEMSQRFADLPNVTVLTLHALAYAHDIFLGLSCFLSFPGEMGDARTRK